MADIKTVAVIGAGFRGRSIAQRAVLAGYRTILVDVLPANLRQAHDEIRNRMEQAGHPGLAPPEAGAVLQRLELASSLADGAREADLVIECVPDEMESKLEIFTLLDKICRPQTILASTTSTVNIDDIASIVFRPAKVLAMKFENDSKLLLVRAHQTDDVAVNACAEAGRFMGLQVTVTRETLPHDA